MASISGGEIRVLLSTDGGTTYKGFALESDCSFEMNAETREVTSKDDAIFRSYVASAKNWTIGHYTEEFTKRESAGLIENLRRAGFCIAGTDG